MNEHLALATTLRYTILDDLLKDFDYSHRWVRKLLEPLVWASVNRFAVVATRFDETVAVSGFREAMGQLLWSVVHEINLDGEENIPVEGPLLVVSNHPGTYDSLAIAASLPRDDLNIVATGFPLLRSLPSTRSRFIFIDPSARVNLSAVRATTRHLQSGGAVLIFPSGRVEPDPAVLPGALASLQAWSPSLELFLRSVPETKVVVSVVSGVLSPVFLRNPLIRLWRGMRDPQMVAEVTQIAVQMIFRNWVRLTPKVSFNKPKSVNELFKNSGSLFHAVITEVHQLLAEHIQGRSSGVPRGTVPLR